ncbi:CGGC domain-containing protein [Halanaerobiaceae bacterium Z-7014]|uniref:CGGC domain-containing protein n=1 Tax=Halonatronomonas betaini TaxID=2778430 RepID=A0A931F6D8_9FIRM|nr:CGGC domain-containing protein [Halonatronomonas betaini]MBF8435476.1 CGGC domain-containing protein [Halonatronomonas betaini]
MRIGVIRCFKNEGNSNSEISLDNLNQKIKDNIDKDYNKLAIVGSLTCGGCPGKKAVKRVKKLLKEYADYVYLDEVISGSSAELNCIYSEKILDAIYNRTAEEKIIISSNEKVHQIDEAEDEV